MTPGRPRRSSTPELVGIGLYDDRPHFSNSPQGSLRLTASVEGAEWKSFHDAIRSIVNLLGGTEVAKRWGWSILSPLQRNWNQESPFVQRQLVAQLHAVYLDISGVETGSRTTNRFFFGGRIPPLQQLLMSLALADSTMQSAEMQRAVEWFPWIASQFVLQAAKRAYLLLFANSTSTSEEMIDAYWKAFEGAIHCQDPSLVQACTDLSGHLVEKWGSLLIQEQWCAIAIFKTLSNLLFDVESHGHISKSLLYLWVPDQDQALSTIRAVGQEAVAETFGQDLATTHPLSEPHHQSIHFGSTPHALPFNDSAASSHHLQQHHQRELSHRRPQLNLNHRIRVMYGL
ncbi:hypothetical protein JCM5350_000891 [Sporobolomyces pararoseus]